MAKTETNEVRSSLYVAVPVTPSAPLKRFLETLPWAYGRPMPKHKLHVSLLYSYEFGFEVNDTVSYARLETTRNRVAVALSKLDIVGSVLSVQPAVAVPCGKFLGISFEPLEPLLAAREVACETLEDGLGISIESKLKEVHVSIARRRKSHVSPVLCPISEAAVSVSGPPRVEMVNTTQSAVRVVRDWQRPDYRPLVPSFAQAV